MIIWNLGEPYGEKPVVNCELSSTMLSIKCLALAMLFLTH